MTHAALQQKSTTCACLLLRPLGCHAVSEPSLQLLQVALHLVHPIQAGVQVCVVLLQQVQVGGQPGSTMLLHGGTPLLPSPQGALPTYPLHHSHPPLHLSQLTASSQLQFQAHDNRQLMFLNNLNDCLLRTTVDVTTVDVTNCSGAFVLARDDCDDPNASQLSGELGAE